MKTIALAILLFLPAVAGAVNVETFQTIPFLSGGEKSTQSYIDALYNAAIALGAIAAVLMLMWAGAEYMLSESITSKSKAKERIQNALLGLLIILAAVTLLQTINPNLLRLDVIGQGDAVNLSSEENLILDNNKYFKPGETFDGLTIVEYCATAGGFFPGFDCESAYVEALYDNCLNKHDGGSVAVEKYWNWKWSRNLSKFTCLP